MTKKRKKTKSIKKKRGSLFKNLLFFISLILISIFFLISYNKIQQEKSEKESIQKQQISTKQLISKMRTVLKKESNKTKKTLLDKNSTNKIKKSVTKIEKRKEPPLKTSKKTLKKEKTPSLSEVEDFKKSKKTHKYKNSSKRVEHERVVSKIKYRGLAKLAIVIDDVSFSYQVKLIKKIPYKINPSFFPPTTRHPDTKKLAKEFRFAMIHLPMEALNYNKTESNTLLVSDSKEILKRKILNIKRDFPSIKYYNNHTGSKFTSDTKSMNMFIDIMNSEKLIFVDSRTTINTKAPTIFKQRGLKLLSRDVFLDNSTKPSDIISQLKKAVQLAKKHGYAIAICHPHTNTLKTLIKAKPYLKGIKMVYINEL